MTPRLALGVALALSSAMPNSAWTQEAQTGQDLDRQVREFLDSHDRQWRDMNVPEADGQLLYDLIIEHQFTRALEVGTSTGHSAIWIAWALSKTGGTLTTIEIDERRYQEALRNFEAAGVSDYINARLADAHELVPELEGPYDFVFMDADKDWYARYFQFLLPKLDEGACFAAHNVSGRTRGMAGFLDELEATPGVETEIVRASRSGMSVTCRTS